MHTALDRLTKEQQIEVYKVLRSPSLQDMIAKAINFVDTSTDLGVVSKLECFCGLMVGKLFETFFLVRYTKFRDIEFTDLSVFMVEAADNLGMLFAADAFSEVKRILFNPLIEGIDLSLYMSEDAQQHKLMFELIKEITVLTCLTALDDNDTEFNKVIGVLERSGGIKIGK